jgi:phosphoenolpyruvate carboxylase
MTDTTDDIAEEISFQGFDDYCKLLKNLLNDVLQREVGTDFVEKLERNRTLAQVFFFFLLLLLLFLREKLL